MSRRLGWSRGVLALLVAGSSVPAARRPHPLHGQRGRRRVGAGHGPVRARLRGRLGQDLHEMAARPENKKVPFAYLALSGGGGERGLRRRHPHGWTESGKRPEFSLVSGVSTGALIAPFAFVGPEYDAVLKDIYTSGIASTLVQSPSVTNILFGSACSGTGACGARAPLRHAQLLAAVAAQHAKGRRLLVVTTNLDSQRAVIWNMGAIATNGAPPPRPVRRRAHRLRQHPGGVSRPSSSTCRRRGRLPGEHVDGSVVTRCSPCRNRSSCATGASRPCQVRHLRHHQRAPGAANSTSPRTTPCPSSSARSTTASRARSRATMATTYAFTRANGIGFNLTYIDESPPTPRRRGLRHELHARLYEAGYQAGRTGTFWHKNVPTAPC